MKTNYFLMALIVLVGTTAYANGPGDPGLMVISQRNAGVFKVIYEGEKTGNVKMTIFDQDAEVVFTETTKDVHGFIRSVNFTRMEPGEYTIEIDGGGSKTSQKVLYTLEPTIKNIRVSKIKEGDKYLLTVANQGAEQINVRIFDGANNLVHTENRTINGDFGLVYNLKDVSGVPTFEVTDKAGFIHTIK